MTPTEILQNLKEHWRKYVFLSFFIIFVLRFTFITISNTVHRAILISESILHLSPRAVTNNNPILIPGGAELLREKAIPKGLDVGPNKNPKYVPPEGNITITPKDPTKTLDELVNIKYKEWGLTHGLGLEGSIAPLGIGLDIKLVYFYRLGGNIGINYFRSFDNRDFITPTIGLSYHLDRVPLLIHSEILLGYSPLGLLPAYLALRLSL